jgi:hypothetical protein
VAVGAVKSAVFGNGGNSGMGGTAGKPSLAVLAFVFVPSEEGAGAAQRSSMQPARQ